MTKNVLIYLADTDDVIDRFKDILDKHDNISKRTKILWEQHIEDKVNGIEINTNRDHPQDFAPNIKCSLPLWEKWFDSLEDVYLGESLVYLKILLEMGERKKNARL
jgi:hypothetical protein